MSMQELRGLTDEQLREELQKARREVFNLRFRAMTRQLANTHQVGHARKQVARLLTIQWERRLAAVSQQEQ